MLCYKKWYIIICVLYLTAAITGCTLVAPTTTGNSSTTNTTTTTTSTTPTTSIATLETLGFSNAPSAILNQSFIRQLPAAGGVPPYTWTLVSGSLPTGLTSNSKGQITGTPTGTGSFTYRLRLTDAQGKFVETEYTQNVVESGTSQFVFIMAQYLPYNENQAICYVPFVQGGKQPWTFTISGLPAGVTYDPVTGLIKGMTSTADVLPITITLKDDDGNEAIGSPFIVSYIVRPPKPVNIGSGKSVYDGTYTGIFNYSYEDKSDPPKTIPGGFRLIIKLAHTATAQGITVLQITYASCSDPYFGCQVGGCTPNFGSVATLPAEPPTTPSNPSQAGMGIAILFPNGASLATTNSAGALNVGYGGWMLSNSLDPAIQNQTWVAASLNPDSPFLPQATGVKFISWGLSWSAAF